MSRMTVRSSPAVIDSSAVPDSPEKSYSALTCEEERKREERKRARETKIKKMRAKIKNRLARS